MSEWWEKRFVDFSTQWIIAHDMARPLSLYSLSGNRSFVCYRPHYAENLFLFFVFSSHLCILAIYCVRSFRYCLIEYCDSATAKKRILFHPTESIIIFSFNFVPRLLWRFMNDVLGIISLATNVADHIVCDVSMLLMVCSIGTLIHYAVRSSAWIVCCLHFHLRVLALLFSVASIWMCDERRLYAASRSMLSVHFVFNFVVVDSPHVKCAACSFYIPHLQVCLFVYFQQLEQIVVEDALCRLFTRDYEKDDRSPFAIDHTHTSTAYNRTCFSLFKL